MLIDLLNSRYKVAKSYTKKYTDEVKKKQEKRDKKHRLDTIAKKFTSSEEKLVVEAIERNVK